MKKLTTIFVLMCLLIALPLVIADDDDDDHDYEGSNHKDYNHDNERKSHNNHENEEHEDNDDDYEYIDLTDDFKEIEYQEIVYEEVIVQENVTENQTINVTANTTIDSTANTTNVTQTDAQIQAMSDYNPLTTDSDSDGIVDQFDKYPGIDDASMNNEIKLQAENNQQEFVVEQKINLIQRILMWLGFL